MRTRIAFASAAIALLAVASGARGVAAQAHGRPNVLVVLADDMGSIYTHVMIQKLRREIAGFGNSDVPGNTTEQPRHEQSCSPLPSDQTRPTDPRHPDLLMTSTCDICDPRSPLHAGGPTDLDVCTPNLDRLAREGVMFPTAYAGGASCENARQSLWTGLMQRDLAQKGRKFGCEFGGWETLPETLSANDYVTYYAGKMDLGNAHYRHIVCAPESTRNVAIGESKSLAKVKRFLKGYPYATSPPRAGKPWFVVWAPKMPHYSYRYPREWGNPDESGRFANGLYKTTAVNVPDASTKARGDFHLPGTQLGSDESTRGYYRSVTYVDARVGELVEFLEDLEFGTSGLEPNADYDPYPTAVDFDPADNPNHRRFTKNAWTETDRDKYAGFRSNTLIIFLSDQAAGMDNSKAHFSENGMRNPIILNYRDPRTEVGPIPGQPGRDDTQTPTFEDDLVHAIDLYPTVLDFAGLLWLRDGQGRYILDAQGRRVATRTWPDARSFKDLATNAANPYPAPRQQLFLEWRDNGEVSATTRPIGAGESLLKLYTDTPITSTVVQPNRMFDLCGEPTADHPQFNSSECSPFERVDLLAAINTCAGSPLPCRDLQGMLDCWVDKAAHRDDPGMPTSADTSGNPATDCALQGAANPRNPNDWTGLLGTSYEGYTAINCGVSPPTHSACTCAQRRAKAC